MMNFATLKFCKKNYIHQITQIDKQIMTKKNFVKFAPMAAMAVAVMATSCSGEQQQQQTAAQYPVITVAKKNQTILDNYSASIRGRQDVSVMPQVSGTLMEIRVNEGEKVRKGQVLFVIDQVPYRAQLSTAQANVESAKAQVAQAQLSYDSKKTLREKNVVSDFDLMTAENTLLTAKAGLAQANAQLTNAQNSLSYTEVKSPADGVVGILPYRVGALVGPSIQTPLTTVSDNSTMYVYFSMNENQVLSLTRQYGSAEKAVRNMPEVSLRLSDDSLYNRKGRIETISGVIDQSTGTAQLRATFVNPDGLLLSGTNGTVIIERDIEGAIVIPQAATFEVQDKVFVYEIKEGRAASRQVSVTRIQGGSDYLVNSGLAEGDVIVAQGVGLLREGTPIAPKN